LQVRLPALLELPPDVQGPIWLDLVDAAAKYDIALLPHLGVLLPPGISSAGAGDDAAAAAAAAVGVLYLYGPSGPAKHTVQHLYCMHCMCCYSQPARRPGLRDLWLRARLLACCTLVEVEPSLA
jgi:hypothetical protein